VRWKRETVPEAERRRAEAAGEPWAERLDLGRRWSGGAPLPHVVTGEGVCVLVCHAEDVDPGWDGTDIRFVSPSDAEPSPLLVYTFRSFHSVRYGGPNDEALKGHPLFERGLEYYAPHVVHRSPWLAEAERINAVHEQHRPEDFARLHHYLFTFHDEMFEALAPDVEVREVRSTLAEQLQQAVAVVTAEPEWPDDAQW
jgi:hypothetical protein